MGDGADKWSPPGSERSCGTQLSEMERESSESGAGRIFRAPRLTGHQCVMPVWHANQTKMANSRVKLLSCGKYVGAILRVFFRTSGIRCNGKYVNFFLKKSNTNLPRYALLV